jgi:soluble lytic murein transglycosylase-like protein
MRSCSWRGLGGAFLAVLVFAAVWVVPNTVTSSWKAPPPMPVIAAAAAMAAAEVAAAEVAQLPAGVVSSRGAHAAFLRSVQELLATRMRETPAEDRARIAQTIVAEAEAARLDPVLVLALIGVESSFDPNAESMAGAFGLMQLRPDTLWHEAERSRLDLSDPTDPVLNVRAGIRYYRRLLSAFRSHELALMAYNAGPNRIKSYLDAGEVPERFYAYPRKVRDEFRRLRAVVAPSATQVSEPL